MSQASFVISKLLIKEAVVGGKDCDSWNTIIDTYVMDLLKRRRMELLSAPTRLAIAISIVGSRRLDLFTTAFRLLCDWDHIGGPYWLVQEELLRFAAIHLFKCEMEIGNADKSITTCNIRKQLPDILPNDLPHYVTHKILRKRIHFLRTEFEWLLDDIRRASKSETEVVFLEYTDRFPLDLFIDWFLSWAQSLLKEFGESTLHNTSCSQLNIESTCRMNMLCTPPPQTVSLIASGYTVRRQLYQPVQSKTNCDMRDRETLHDKTQSSCRITEEGRKVNGNILENSDKRTDCNETTHSNRCFLKPKAQYELKGSIYEDSYDNRNHDSPHSAHRYEDSPQVTTENTKKRIFIASVRKNDNMHTTEKRRKTVLNASKAKLKIIIPESNPLKSTGVIKQNMKAMDKRKAVAVTIEKRNVKEEQDNSDNNDAYENDGFSRNLEGLLGLESTVNLKVREQEMVEDTDSTVSDDGSSSNGENNVRIKEEFMRVNKDKEIPMSKLPNEDAIRINQTSKQIEEDNHEDDASPVEDSKSPEKEDSEWRKYLSPLTPHSGSSSGSSRTVPQMECSSKAIDEKSDVAESDDGTEYYESASEDQNEESGILTNLAKSVWGIFSLSCH